MKSSEANEQATLIQWCKLNSNKYPKLDLIFAIPNGGKRNLKEAHNLRLQGVRAGVMDLFLPVASNGKHGLWIEMKYGKNTLTQAQQYWYWKMIDEGYEVRVCYSADEAIEEIKSYLKIK